MSPTHWPAHGRAAANAPTHPRGWSHETLTDPDAIRAEARAAASARADIAAERKAQAATQTGPAPQLPEPSSAQLALLDAGLGSASKASVRSPFLPAVTLPNDQDWHLARRVAPGASAAIVADIRAKGRSAWLAKQLAPASIPDPVCQNIIAQLPAVSMTARQAVIDYYGYDYGWKIAPAVIRASWIRRVYSTRLLFESMVEFWHDVLHVTAESDAAAYWIGDYDTYVIRKLAMGKFSTLLAAATRHGAMLDYLDNSLSTKDAPNENLGRELLELHTLGAGNFTEQDVKQAALLLTGWHGDWEIMRGVFDPGIHHVGRITVAGITHANATPGAGPAALTAILNGLARHPKTAQRLCYRLCVRFVSDQPPAALVSRLATIYRANDTAIVPVLRALFLSPEFAASIGKKWRRPSELMASMVRARTPSPPSIDPATAKEDPYSVMGTDAWLLDIAGHLPLNWPPPDGYPDVATRWMHTNGMLSSWNSGEAVAGDWSGEYGTAPSTIAFGVSATMTPRAIADRLFRVITGFPGDPNARAMLARYLWSGDPFGDLPPTTTTPIGADRIGWHLDEATRMVFSSPYFQIR